MLNKLGRSPITFLVGGFVVSGCAVGLIALFAVAVISLRPKAPNPPNGATPTLLPPSPLPAFSAPTELAPTAAQTTGHPLLRQAEQLLADGQPQAAVDLLKEHLAEFAEPFEKAQAYELMGRAEMELAYFQFAASHFNQAYTLAASHERLFYLALAYDLGGNLEQALQNYEALLTQPRLEEEFRSIAEERVKHLREVLGLATPVKP